MARQAIRTAEEPEPLLNSLQGKAPPGWSRVLREFPAWESYRKGGCIFIQQDILISYGQERGN